MYEKIKIAIVGLGYLVLPGKAILFKYSVIGFDINIDRVNG